MMQPIPRILAVLQDGPSVGIRVSIEAQGDTPPEFVFQDTTYRPAAPLDTAQDQLDSLATQAKINAGEADETDKHRLFHGFELSLPADVAEGIISGHHFIAVWKYSEVNSG